MPPFIHLTDEQKQSANLTDLPDFLRRQGERLERSGHEWRWERHNSVTLKGNRWYRHSSEYGGYPVDFVREFYDKSYPEAVLMLLGCEQVPHSCQNNTTPNNATTAFVLPERNETMRRVFAYLMKQRFISGDVITHFAHEQTLYEDAKYHNAVFVGCDENGVPRHAHKRGTYTHAGSYKGNVTGSDSHYPFRCIGNSDTLFVFEAPIDMLSYITLHPKNWQENNYVTLDGVSEHGMLTALTQNPHLQKVRLCLDNDPAGIDAVYRLTEILNAEGYTDVEANLPTHKDWNETLKAKHGCPALSAQGSPKLAMFDTLCDHLRNTLDDDPGTGAAPENIAKLCDRLRTRPDSDTLTEITALALYTAKNRLRQLGRSCTIGEVVDMMKESYAPHRDRAGLRSRTEDIVALIKSIQTQEDAKGVRLTSEREKTISDYLNLACECTKALSCIAWEEQSQSAPGDDTEELIALQL